jgi:hypothetical protein
MKGTMLNQFPVGTLVEFRVRGETKHGNVTKLYKSCVCGVAKIKPTDGSKTLTRRLQQVWRPR